MTPNNIAKLSGIWVRDPGSETQDPDEKTYPGSGTATLIYLPMVQIMVARVVKISTARERVRTVNRSDSQNILEAKGIQEERSSLHFQFYMQCCGSALVFQCGSGAGSRDFMTKNCKKFYSCIFGNLNSDYQWGPRSKINGDPWGSVSESTILILRNDWYIHSRTAQRKVTLFGSNILGNEVLTSEEMRLSGIPCIKCNPGTKKALKGRIKEGTRWIYNDIYVNHLPVDVWKDDRSQGGNLGVGQVTWQLLQHPHGALHRKFVLPFQSLNKKKKKTFLLHWHKKEEKSYQFLAWKTKSKRKYYNKGYIYPNWIWKRRQKIFFLNIRKLKFRTPRALVGGKPSDAI